METIIFEKTAEGRADIILNRPRVHNAFNRLMVVEIHRALKMVAADESLRVLVIRGRGRSFCAGADLKDMAQAAKIKSAENQAQAEEMAWMFKELSEIGKPTVALVHGTVLGGGVGLVACADLVLAEKGTIFGFSEVRLGLVPALISPYVIEAIGSRAAKAWFLSAERFSVKEARRLGLVHEVVRGDLLASAGGRLVDSLLAGGPKAQAAVKALVRRAGVKNGVDDLQDMAELIATLRASAEGAEGVRAFLERRAPSWTGRS